MAWLGRVFMLGRGQQIGSATLEPQTLIAKNETPAEPPSFFRRRKPKDEERLFLCERRLRNPHTPRFSAPKIFRGTVAQYLPSRAYSLVTGSFEVREFHSYVVDVGAMIFNMEIVSGHDSAPISTGGSNGLSCPQRQGTCRSMTTPA
jgi:hypothetical protein